MRYVPIYETLIQFDVDINYVGGSPGELSEELVT